MENKKKRIKFKKKKKSLRVIGFYSLHSLFLGDLARGDPTVECAWRSSGAPLLCVVLPFEFICGMPLLGIFFPLWFVFLQIKSIKSGASWLCTCNPSGREIGDRGRQEAILDCRETLPPPVWTKFEVIATEWRLETRQAVAESALHRRTPGWAHSFSTSNSRAMNSCTCFCLPSVSFGIHLWK